MIKNFHKSFLLYIILAFGPMGKSVFSSEIPDQQKQKEKKFPEIHIPQSKNLDDDDSLLSIKKPEFQRKIYKPAIKSLDFSFNYGVVLWDLIRRIDTHHKILTFEGDIGIWSGIGLYPVLTIGYSDTQSKGIPLYMRLPDYTLNSIYGKIGLGYYLEYINGGIIGFVLKYGISFFRQENNESLLKTHYINLLLDTKAKLFSNMGFFMGINIGPNFLIKSDSLEGIDNFIVPGYGRNINKITLSFALYIQYSFNFCKDYYSN